MPDLLKLRVQLMCELGLYIYMQEITVCLLCYKSSFMLAVVAICLQTFNVLSLILFIPAVVLGGRDGGVREEGVVVVVVRLRGLQVPALTRLS